MSLSYRVGAWVGKHPLASLLIISVVAVWAVASVRPAPAPAVAQPDPAAQAAAAAKLQTAQEQRRAEAIQACRDKALPLARSEAKAGKMMAARATLHTCTEYLDRPDEKDFVQRVAKGATAEEEKNRRLVDAADKARRKREGVRIGMTQEEVLLSSWGRPTKVNRTISASGVNEQWVYEGFNYLYFRDGVLTTIQN